VQFCAGLPGPVRVAYEAGPTGFGLARALEPIGTESLDGGLAWLRYRMVDGRPPPRPRRHSSPPRPKSTPTSLPT
jgi:hypothetical protein